ncbi:hypothetical protein Tco_0117977 [Tanacetum coccineum]
MKWYDYGYLEEIKVRREDQQLYKFKEGDFLRLHLHNIEEMLLFLVQKKLFNLERDVIFDLGVALRMFTRRIVILKRVEDLNWERKLQKKLNITKPETFSSLDRKRSRTMIKAIDQQLLERRLMRRLEKFVGGRDYREDLRLLQRAI